MLHLNSAVQRQPLGGHHFKAHGVLFKEDTFKELVVKLRTFRLNNLLTVGMPDQEILAYYAEKFPWMVRADGKDIPKENSEFARWRNWITKVWNNPPQKLLTTKEASDRWAICAECPHKKDLPTGELKELSEVSKRAYQLRRGIDAPKNYCSCFGADLSILSFIESPEKFVGAEEKPAKCWVGLAGQ